ncbi:MAG: hypothetical protein AMXMBFR31_28440 [Candidatus Desulfobacillus denitrificans]
MALDFKEAIKLVDAGKAGPAVRRFIVFATQLAILARTGQIKDDLPGVDDTIIAAVALERMMNTKDGRKLLGIKASNKVYNAKDYPLDSPKLDIGRRLICGELTQPEALDALRALLAAADIHPDPKTLKQHLRDIEDHAHVIRESLAHLMRVAGWDGSASGLQDTFAAIIGNKGARK